MTETIRCLLASPTPGRDGESGDVQYTRDLLANPPENVEYVTYAQALDRGELVEGPSIRQGASLISRPGALGLATLRAGLHAARRSGLLLPDPVRWWRVVGQFDVIHEHCIPLRLLGQHPPVVLTDSAGTFWYWTAAKGRAEGSVWRLLGRERRVAGLLGYTHPTARPDAASQVRYFVQSGKDLAERLGIDSTPFGLAPAGVPFATCRAALRGDPPKLLFVARNFEIKGGPDAIGAWRLIRRQLPECQLLIAGPEGSGPQLDGVIWLGPRSRQELYETIYPAVDLFLYPTRFDVAPLVVAEALAHGVPVVGPRAFGLPDLVRHEVTGLLVEPGRVDQLSSAALRLLTDRCRLRRFGQAAAEDFRLRLSVDVRNSELEKAYRLAIGAAQGYSPRTCR